MSRTFSSRTYSSGSDLSRSYGNRYFEFLPEVVDFIARVEAADGAPIAYGIKEALNNFVVVLKANGFSPGITGCHVAYIPIANTLAGSLIPFINNCQYNGRSFTAIGYVENDWSPVFGWIKGEQVTTKYINTNYQLLRPLSLINTSLMYRCMYGEFNLNSRPLGVNKGVANELFSFSKTATNLTVNAYNNTTTFTTASSSKNGEGYIDLRLATGANNGTLKQDGVTMVTTTMIGADNLPISTDLYFNGDNNNGTPRNANSPSSINLLLYGTLLSVAQHDNIRNAYTTYKTALVNGI